MKLVLSLLLTSEFFVHPFYFLLFAGTLQTMTVDFTSSFIFTLIALAI